MVININLSCWDSLCLHYAQELFLLTSRFDICAKIKRKPSAIIVRDTKKINYSNFAYITYLRNKLNSDLVFY